jgi:hypothetical protein
LPVGGDGVQRAIAADREAFYFAIAASNVLAGNPVVNE